MISISIVVSLSLARRRPREGFGKLSSPTIAAKARAPKARKFRSKAVKRGMQER